LIANENSTSQAEPGNSLLRIASPLSTSLKREDHTSLEAEVALIVVATSERIAKSGQNVVELTWSDRY
jgi:hypothetical protein